MKRTVLLLASFAFTGLLFAQTAKQFWQSVDEKRIANTGERVIIPKKYKTFELVSDNLKNALWSAPDEKNVKLNESQVIIELPMPDGSLEKFRVVYSPVMAPELAAQFPDIKTFNVMGVDEPGVFGKLDWTEKEFHGMIRKVSGDIFIDPYARNNYIDYITYNTSDFQKDPSHVVPEIGVIDPEKDKKESKKKEENVSINSAKICAGTNLRTYRLAVACTGEYAKAATGQAAPTVAQTLAKIVTSVNRVDGVYETEVAVKMILVASETLVVFTDPATDPFTGNSNGGTLIGESQTVIDNKIGSANYDVGHTFSTGGGGLASLGVPCKSGSKASGITGSGNPVGDPYDIDYVAHELGHQFAGNHTFRSATSSCSGNGNSTTRVEPGSGITIMAYAGICGADDLAPHSIPYFHTISFDEIMAYTNTGSGNSCPVNTATGNKAPVVTGSATYNVPKSTPFTLTGSATDPDGDALTYQWEEIDNGASFGTWNSGTKPFFMSYAPVTTPSRTFPKLSMVLAGSSTYTTTKGEFLPTTAQTLNFRLTARDNKTGGGGVCYENSQVVITNDGPFTVTYPSATAIIWASASAQTVTWNVNGTSAAPISCANVNILFSSDGGQTFSTLMSNVPNSGSQAITAPSFSTTVTTCRIKVEGAGNIFFDIGDNNFTISALNGINNFPANNIAMQVFPNPANNQVKISIFGLNRNEKVNLNVYDLLGNSIMKDVLTGKENYELNYDVSQLTQGIYFLEVSGSSRKSVSKLVKQ